MPFTPSADRTLVVTPPWGGSDANALISFEGEDKISQPYSYRLTILSDQLNIDPATTVGAECTFTIKDGEDSRADFAGFVWRFSAEGTYLFEDTMVRAYNLELAPALKFMTMNRNSRVFQEVTVPDVIEAILGEAEVSFTNSLTATYPTLDYCVQWRESDFDFITRLMKDAGIFYIFDRSSSHQLVLLDDTTGYLDLTATGFGMAGEVDDGGIESWSHTYRMAPAKAIVAEYEFQTPEVLTSEEATTADLSNLTEVYDYPGSHEQRTTPLTADDLGPAALRRIQGYERKTDVVKGTGRWESFLPGYKFTLNVHSVEDEQSVEYVLTSVKHRVKDPYLRGNVSDTDTYINEFECIPATTPYTPLPSRNPHVIVGPQPATVVGASGDVVHTDELGRIRVSFPWDRESTMDDKCSCWVRVSQGWAGEGWGSFFLPRVGQEVLVEFINGDPNRPIVTGSVYNGTQVVPATLPDEKLHSTIKSNSGTDRHNEIRFIDTENTEEFYVQAQYNYQRVVLEGNETVNVGYDKEDAATGTAGDQASGCQTIKIMNHRTVTIEEGMDSLNITTGDREVVIEAGNDTLEVATDQTITVKGAHTLDVTGASEFISADSITLKVGSNSIVIDQQGITIEGSQVTITGTATAEVGSPATTVAGDGTLTLEGGLVKIN